MNDEVCVECGGPATTHPQFHEEWGPLPFCEACASEYEDEGEVLDEDQIAEL